MNLIYLLFLIFVIIIGISILKNLIKIIGMLLILAAVVWFFDKEGLIEIKHSSNGQTIVEPNSKSRSTQI